MVTDFHIGNKNDASFWCGILIASFSLAEATSSMWWGSLSDRIGRKPVLLLGCFGTCISLLMVGFSNSFAMALTGRILGGLLNGNIGKSYESHNSTRTDSKLGVIQTMVGELVTKPEHEPKAYSIMPFVWSIGTIFGPMLGGLLADPVKAYPSHFTKHGFFGRFPWALPNIVCAFLMVISMFAVYFWLEETHPDFRKGADITEHHTIAEQTPMVTAAGVNADPGIDLRQESYGTFNEVDMPQKEGWSTNADGTRRPPSFTERSTPREKWFTWQVAMLTVALGIFTYHSMCYDHLLPIFYQDPRAGDPEFTTSSVNLLHVEGGLGLSTNNVGVIMAVNGLIALAIQAIVFPYAAEKLGIWRVFVIVTILHPTAYFIVPYLALLPDNALYAGIYTSLGIRNLLSILAYPALLILLRQASISAAVLGRINGLGASVGAGCRTMAPPIAGLLYGWGQEIGFTGLAYWGTGFVALLGAAQLYFVPRQRKDVSVKSLVPGLPGAQDNEQIDETEHTDRLIRDV